MDAVKTEVNGSAGGGVSAGGGSGVGGCGNPLPQRQQKMAQGVNKPFNKNPSQENIGGPVEKKPRFAVGMQPGNQGGGAGGNNKPGMVNKNFVNRNRNRGAGNSPNKGNFQNMHNSVSVLVY